MGLVTDMPSVKASKEEKIAMQCPVPKVKKFPSYFLFLKFDQMTSGFRYSSDKTLGGFESAQS